MLNVLCMVEPHVVQHHYYFGVLSIFQPYFLQMLFERPAIALLRKVRAHLTALVIVAAEQGKPLPFALLAGHLGLFSFLAPFVAYCSRVAQRAFILEKQHRVGR